MASATVRFDGPVLFKGSPISKAANPKSPVRRGSCFFTLWHRVFTHACRRLATVHHAIAMAAALIRVSVLAQQDGLTPLRR